MRGTNWLPSHTGRTWILLTPTIATSGWLITGVVTSAAWFDGLPADLQKIVREEALKAGDQASRATEASLADYEKQMAAKGMTVTTIDVAPFREATAGVYEKLGYGELRKEIDKFLTN